MKRELAGEPELLVPYVNCRDMTGPEDLYSQFVRALSGELEHKKALAGLWHRFRGIFGEKLLRAATLLDEIGGEIGEWGKVYLRFREREVDAGELVCAAFSFPARIAEEHRLGVVFLLDEFQALLKTPLQAEVMEPGER